MARRSERRILRLGATTLVLLALVMAAAFNLQNFPGFKGTTYRAEFADASGLRPGQMVQVAGLRVGKVGDLALEDGRVVVEFDVDPGVELGPETSASVEVLNLLGEKYLELQPAGDGLLAEGATIPLERTRAAYDIVGVLGDLTETTEQIDTAQLSTALDTVAATLDQAGPEIRGAFDGLSRLSRTLNSRDEELERLLTRADSVTAVLAERRTDLVALFRSSSLVFDELDRRREAINDLLVGARTVATELRGVAEDNRAELAPALEQLSVVTDMLVEKKQQVRATAAAVGPYADILGNIVGTGPWFDAYLVNLGGIPTGEFLPGPRRAS